MALMRVPPTPPRPTLFRAPRPTDLVERAGGHMVSTAVFVVVFLLLALTPIMPPAAEAISAVKMVMIPEETLELVDPQNSPTMPDENVATFAKTADTPAENPIEPVDESVPIDPIQGVHNWTPATDEDRALVERVLASVADNRDRMERMQVDVAAEVQRRQIETLGEEFAINSDGGQSGIIRTLDVAGFPDTIVRPLLSRYGIEIERRPVSPSDQRGFLNAATLQSGTFTNQMATGVQEVFVISPKAVAMMAGLETQALMKNGHNPRDTRIRKITFGIVKSDEEEFALGVTDIQLERVR